jgi:hypothetical protein
MLSISPHIFNSLEAVNDKFRKLVGSDAHADTMEREIDRLSGYACP